MRRVELPIICDAETGNWLNVGAITYDENNKIIEIEHFDGGEFVTYEKGEFEVEHEGETAPLYDKRYEFKILKEDMRNYTKKCENLCYCTLNQLLDLYGSISVLIQKTFGYGEHSKKIFYTAQELQQQINEEIKNRVK